VSHEPYFPVALNLAGRRCVVIGQAEKRGTLARARALEECGAAVRVLEGDALVDSDVDGAFFVIVAAFGDSALGERVGRLAQRYGFLYCCIDQPEYGNVANTALAKAGDTRIAISTSGNAPGVAKALRKALERALDERYTNFVKLLGGMRRELRRGARTSALRKQLHGFDVEIRLRYPAWYQDAAES
jgi:precorrin-2 dehydrogenase/sirohydrochlorin ferrochelatase